MSATGLADMRSCTAHVGFQMQSGHALLHRTCTLMTQSGHRNFVGLRSNSIPVSVLSSLDQDRYEIQALARYCDLSSFASRNWKIGRNRAKFVASRACCRPLGGATARSQEEMT